MSSPFSGYIRGALCLFFGLFILFSPLTHQSVHAMAAITLNDATANPGTAFTFPPTINQSASNPSCIWTKDGIIIEGANGCLLTFTPVQLSDAGLYEVIYLDGSTELGRDTATLTVNNGVSLVNQTVFEGQSVNIEAIISQSSSNPNFVWRFNGNVIPGEGDTVLRINAAQLSDQGTYTIEYFDGSTLIGTSTAQLTVVQVFFDPPVDLGNLSTPENGILTESIRTNGPLLTVNGQPFISGHVLTLSSGAQLTISTSFSSTLHDIVYDPNGKFDFLNDGQTATDTFTVANSVGSTTFTVTITGVGDNQDVIISQTKRVISNFVSRRADQISSNDPGFSNRLQRQKIEDNSDSPVQFTATGTLLNNKFTFSTSLRQMAISKEKSNAKQRKALGNLMSLGTQSLTNNIEPNGLDVWARGQWSESNSGSSDTELGLLHIGIDYRFDNNLLIGLLTQFDWVDEEDNSINANVDGKGWMVGPYFIARIQENLILDARAAWGQSDNDVSPFGTYKDSFDTDRWLLRARLTGDFDYKNINFAPHVGVIYLEEDIKSYTDSNGLFISGQNVQLGQLTFGPKVRAKIEQKDGTVITPHLGIKGIWNFKQAETVDVISGVEVGSDDVRAKINSGLGILFNNGVSLNGEAFYDGIGASDFEAYGGSVKVTVPLN